MENIRIKIPTTLSRSLLFRILLFLIWTQYTIVPYALAIVKRLPYIGGIADFLFPLTVIAMTILTIPRFQKHVRFAQVLFYLIAVIVILGNMVLYQRNAKIIEDNLVRMMVYALPMLFVGVSYEHENDKKTLFWASFLGLAVTLIRQIMHLAQVADQMEYDMDKAYKILPSIAFLLYYAVANKKLRYWLIATVGFFVMFTFGTRGPILCLLVLLAVYILIAVKNAKTVIGKVALIGLSAVMLFIMLSGEAMVKTAKVLSEQFSEWGFSARIFDYFLEGNIMEDSGRGELTARVLEAIGERPLLGNGLLGDQMILGNGQPGYYAHNLFLELWCQFGILFGTLLILYFIGWPIAAVYKQRSNKDLQMFLLMLICMNFTKLMLSSTYTVEMHFFFMLGVCMSVTKKRTLNTGGITNTHSAAS